MQVDHKFKYFPLSSQKNLSNESHLTLSSLKRSSNGKYMCEVSADAPSFHTLMVSKELRVVDPAITHAVHIEHEDAPYRIGDTLEVNCTKLSSPAANLTWFLNEQQVSGI